MGYTKLPKELWPRAAFVQKYGRRPHDQAELDLALATGLISPPKDMTEAKKMERSRWPRTYT